MHRILKFTCTNGGAVLIMQRKVGKLTHSKEDFVLIHTLNTFQQPRGHRMSKQRQLTFCVICMNGSEALILLLKVDFQ